MDKLEFETRDGDKFILPLEMARHMGTIRNMLNVCSSKSEAVIPLTKIGTRAMKRILRWLVHHTNIDMDSAQLEMGDEEATSTTATATTTSMATRTMPTMPTRTTPTTTTAEPAEVEQASNAGECGDGATEVQEHEQDDGIEDLYEDDSDADADDEDNVSDDEDAHMPGYQSCATLVSNMSSFDRNLLANLPQSELFELMDAAHFLQIPTLENITCIFVANNIKGKTPDELRTYFDERSDFKPGQRRQMAREFNWGPR